MKWPFNNDTVGAPGGPAGGVMDQRMQRFDWAASSLGPVAGWPRSLKSAVRLLLDCQLPMYLAWGPDFIQFYNDAYVPILGVKDGEALGGDARITWSEIWPTIGPMWHKVLRGAGIGAEQFRLTIERYGYPEDCYFSFSYSAVPDDDGEPAGVLVTFADITNSVLAEQRQAFQLSLSDTLRSLRDPAAITDRATAMLGQHLAAGRAGFGDVLECGTLAVRGDWTDGAMASLAGEHIALDSFGPLVLAELKAGRSVRLDDIGADARSAPYVMADTRANPSANAYTGTGSMLMVPRLQDGKLAAILYLHRPVPYRWRDGDIAIAEDVAHRTGDALTRAFAERELIEANHRKDEFLAMLGHELRNPLAPICSAAQMLKIVTPGDGRFQQAVDVINRQSKHLTALVDDLLDVSRVTKGLVDLNKSEVDIRAVIDSAVEQTRPLFEARRHALTVEHGPPSHTVIGDRTRLVQAISNLLNNAGKYTPPAGAISLSVAVSARRVTVEVRDNGVGIDSDLLPRVFDLFTQAQRTPDRAQGGLGIGLALVKTIVTLHGGEISAYSAGRGAGSKFIMSLPLAGQVRDQNG